MKIAAFNIRKFGQETMSKPDVVNILIKIVSRYDIIVILEVVDKSEKAVQEFVEKLNSKRNNKKKPFSMKLSERVGRSKSKEQFLFLYRKAVVKVEDTYQYPDMDAFEREPFIVYFTCLTAAVKKLVLLPVHTKPTDSGNELQKLYDVVEEVKSKYHTMNIMLVGDFNADGKYLSEKKKKEIKIFTDKNFHLLIDNVDTTTSTSNDYTYDRIVVCGKKLFDAVVLGSEKAFNFQKGFRLSKKFALEVSDHYPVEVELKTKTANE